MKTVTKHIFATYNGTYDDGIAYTVISDDEKELFDRIDSYKYVCEVTIPAIDKSFILDAAVSQIDQENARLQAKISENNAKKQQLLCIEHNEGNNNE